MVKDRLRWLPLTGQRPPTPRRQPRRVAANTGVVIDPFMVAHSILARHSVRDSAFGTPKGPQR